MQKKRITGYQLYSKDTKIRTKQNELPDLYPELPCKKYDIIYADPPWHYNGKIQFDKSSKDRESLDPAKKIFISSASFKYPTVKTKDLMKRREHSMKPDEIRNKIAELFPVQEKIELFARVRTLEWDAWGLDISDRF